MSRDSFVAEGQSAYRRADEQLGAQPSAKGGLIAWLGSGRMPSLWLLARLQLLLALVALAADAATHVYLIFHAVVIIKEARLYATVTHGLAMVSWGVPPAILLVGSAITSYFAGKQDRERRAELSQPAATAPQAGSARQAPPAPAAGSVPSGAPAGTMEDAEQALRDMDRKGYEAGNFDKLKP